ncbi:MAG: binary toxin-like calcium binding domain-containing protein [Candidatus Hodarchaeota archaeon]
MRSLISSLFLHPISALQKGDEYLHSASPGWGEFVLQTGRKSSGNMSYTYLMPRLWATSAEKASNADARLYITPYVNNTEVIIGNSTFTLNESLRLDHVSGGTLIQATEPICAVAYSVQRFAIRSFVLLEKEDCGTEYRVPRLYWADTDNSTNNQALLAIHSFTNNTKVSIENVGIFSLNQSQNLFLNDTLAGTRINSTNSVYCTIFNNVTPGFGVRMMSFTLFPQKMLAKTYFMPRFWDVAPFESWPDDSLLFITAFENGTQIRVGNENITLNQGETDLFVDIPTGTEILATEKIFCTISNTFSSLLGGNWIRSYSLLPENYCGRDLVMPRLWDTDRENTNDNARLFISAYQANTSVSVGTSTFTLQQRESLRLENVKDNTAIKANKPIYAITYNPIADYIRSFELLPFPSSRDRDLDSLTDGEEEFHTTDPLNPDSDDDGLSDGQEVNFYLTDPLNNDTDSDGMLDGWEAKFGTNATSADDVEDYDADGLTNYEEFSNSTNPNNNDTDADGMLDGWEVQHRLNATSAADNQTDFDSDGLTNLEEYRIGTNPNNNDTDADGLPDSWEVQHHLNATSAADNQTDSDSDGLTNLEEYQHRTNPRSNDTDNDSLSDYNEIVVYQSSPLSNDTDADGLPDSWEIKFGTNVSRADDLDDSDGDSLTNYQEFSHNTDPNNSDTDGDGLSDSEEIRLNTNPNAIDTDRDNYSDGEEISLGTDPNNSLDNPAIRQQTVLIIGSIVLILIIFAVVGVSSLIILGKKQGQERELDRTLRQRRLQPDYEPEKRRPKPQEPPRPEPIVQEPLEIAPPQKGTCIVCQLALDRGESILSCPLCGGQAHVKHFKEWIRTKTVCPYCRQELYENQLLPGIFEDQLVSEVMERDQQVHSQCWVCQTLIEPKEDTCAKCNTYQRCWICTEHVDYSEKRITCPECNTPLHERCIPQLETTTCPNPTCDYVFADLPRGIQTIVIPQSIIQRELSKQSIDSEEELETILAENRYLFGEELELEKRQLEFENQLRIDLHFKDKMGRDVFVELKKDELTRKSGRELIGQVQNYEKTGISEGIKKGEFFSNYRIFVVARGYEKDDIVVTLQKSRIEVFIFKVEGEEN